MRKTALGAGLALAALAAAPAPRAAPPVETHTFQGRCDLVGAIPADGGAVTQKGTCTGSLDRGAIENHSVTVVTDATGQSLGPLPLRQEGEGQTTFEEAGVTVGFALDQVGTVLRIIGVNGTTGYGTVLPRPDQPDFFDAKVLFPQEWTGEEVRPGHGPGGPGPADG